MPCSGSARSCPEGAIMNATPVTLLRRALKRSVRNALRAAAPPGESGTHIDPATTPRPDPSSRGPVHAALLASPEMESFRACLRSGTDDIRTSVLRELATYHRISEEEALKRCLRWEEISLQEWRAAEDASSVEGGLLDPARDRSDQARVAFYRTMQSWSYDLLWYGYLQAEGFADNATVMALRWLQQRTRGRRHLDFGAGVGLTSQLFVSRGWTSTLADLSSTLLDFARWRLERHDVDAEYIDLGIGTLPAGAFDAITAIDTLAHVPDVYETARQLAESLAVGGYLIANFDIRAAEDITAWHVQADELTARYDLLRAGFRMTDRLGYDLVAYQRIDVTGFAEIRRLTWLWLTHVSPFRTALRAVARPVLLAARRLLGTTTASAGDSRGPAGSIPAPRAATDAPSGVDR
jgi:SAM-dependent methyltransferase